MEKKEENFFIFYLMRLRRPDSLFLFASPPHTLIINISIIRALERVHIALIGSAFVEYKANKKREKKRKGLKE